MIPPSIRAQVLREAAAEIRRGDVETNEIGGGCYATEDHCDGCTGVLGREMPDELADTLDAMALREDGVRAGGQRDGDGRGGGVAMTPAAIERNRVQARARYYTSGRADNRGPWGGARPCEPGCTCGRHAGHGRDLRHQRSSDTRRLL